MTITRYIVNNEVYSSPEMAKNHAAGRETVKPVKIELTMSELHEAYDEIEDMYHLQDAQNHLLWYVGFDDVMDDAGEAIEDDPGTAQLFLDTYGFSIDEAINDSSEHYLLRKIVDMYLNNGVDCNQAENDQWDRAVSDALALLRYKNAETAEEEN